MEAIGRNSNLGHICKKWADLRERINASSPRPPLLYQDKPKTRSKRFLTAQNVADIAARYQAGETTQLVGSRYGISKTRVATVLREQGITIRRQGLTEEQISEAAALYKVGRSLAWIGTRYGVSTRPSPLRFAGTVTSCGLDRVGLKPCHPKDGHHHPLRSRPARHRAQRILDQRIELALLLIRALVHSCRCCTHQRRLTVQDASTHRTQDHRYCQVSSVRRFGPLHRTGASKRRVTRVS